MRTGVCDWCRIAGGHCMLLSDWEHYPVRVMQRGRCNVCEQLARDCRRACEVGETVADPEICRMRGGTGRGMAPNDQRRLEFHDMKLWKRETRRARLAGMKKMKCPCNMCKGLRYVLLENVAKHLVKFGRLPLFRVWRDRDFAWDSSDEEWCRHDASSSGHHIPEIPTQTAEPQETEYPQVADGQFVDDVDIPGMMADMFGTLNEIREEVMFAGAEAVDEDQEVCAEDPELASMEAKEEALRDACKGLYKGARMSVLGFSMMLMNICYEHNIPNIAVDEIIALLRRKALPETNSLPDNHYQMKKLIGRLGLNYEVIHACNRGCILFRGPYADLNACPTCSAERYVRCGKSQVPVKVLRHFPVIPRLRRMFRSRAISELLTWSSKNTSVDGLVRSVVDSKAWSHFQSLNPDFATEPRNVHFGLAADGVNPFSDKSSTWSTWPVVLINYNLPPWLCTKKFFLHLVLLIPGKESVTSDNIDTYLAPLVEELLSLWKGVTAYDITAEPGKEQFTLRGMLLWTINDYPALGILSGQSSKGRLSCVACGPRVTSEYSSVLHKPIFRGHRKFLPPDHPFRSSRCRLFLGDPEHGECPRRVTAMEILEWAEEKAQYDASGGRANAPGDPYKKNGVKRRSIFFDLPYWKDLLIRHVVDVMHTEKNVSENLLKTILGMKDSVGVRKDLQVRDIRRELWVREHPTRADMFVKPAAPWVLSKTEQETLKNRLAELRVPTGYCGRLQKHILRDKIGHMKSHDFHIFIQQILPVCARDLLNPSLRATIVRLSRIFQRICAKVIDPNDMPGLRLEVVETLSTMESYLPPAFFDNMTHLVFHLVEELEICGPVHCRWMYPIERFLSKLKRYVRNRSRPEGCMAESFLQDEAVGFATEYMANFQYVKTRVWDADEEEGVAGEILEGRGHVQTLTEEMRDLAHHYILKNMECMQIFTRQWELVQAGGDTTSLSEWIHREVRASDSSNHQLVALSKPPKVRCKVFSRMKAYGNHYRIDADEVVNYRTYDSGIAAIGPQSVDVIRSDVTHVGVLESILQLDYGLADDNPVVFKGRWVRAEWDGRTPAMKIDANGFMQVHFRRMMHWREDPFIFPSQVEQVFYTPVESADQLGWNIVMRKESRSRRVVFVGMDNIGNEARPLDLNFENREIGRHSSEDHEVLSFDDVQRELRNGDTGDGDREFHNSLSNTSGSDMEGSE